MFFNKLIYFLTILPEINFLELLSICCLYIADILPIFNIITFEI